MTGSNPTRRFAKNDSDDPDEKPKRFKRFVENDSVFVTIRENSETSQTIQMCESFGILSRFECMSQNDSDLQLWYYLILLLLELREVLCMCLENV